jgi:RND family efflux transporter MFP subunit
VRTFPAACVLLTAASLTACKDRHAADPPPAPPKVTVAPAVQQKITRTLDATGSVAAVNSVDLFARVSGFLQDIGYQDGAQVHKGDVLFTIEPLPYQAKLQQAQAQAAQQQALARQAEAEYQRQAILGKTDAASRSAVDQALANRDSTRAQVEQERANTQQAAVNYTYTRVMAPFDGTVTAHLASVGELVGDSGPTKLATEVQLDPVYVNFNLSERDVLLIRADLAKLGKTIRDVGSVPVSVGLQTETGTPHTGSLDYVAPGIDPSTGTLAARGMFANKDHLLLPGYFVRVSIPVQRDVEAVLVPDVALAADQGGRYVLVLGPGDIVEERHVVPGSLQGALRVIESGLRPGERVIVGGLLRAVPGQKVAPQPVPAG